MMNYLLGTLLLLLAYLQSTAQTPWYTGGKADGHAENSLMAFSPGELAQQSPYRGAKGDGGDGELLQLFSVGPLMHQMVYAGHRADGAAQGEFSTFAPAVLSHENPYLGHRADGAAQSGFQAFTPGDLAQQRSYQGAAGDGGSTANKVNFTPSVLKQFVAYYGGLGDGWSNSNGTFWPLPAVLLSFEGQALPGRNELSWATAYEENTDFFLLEKSRDAVDFAALTRVGAKGYSVKPTAYSATDRSDIDGVRYYRLQLNDRDGKYTYSKVIRLVQVGADYSLTLAPNPTRGQIRLSLSRALGRESRIRLVDMGGRQVAESLIGADESVKSLDVLSLSAGTYHLLVETPEGLVSLPFVKQ